MIYHFIQQKKSHIFNYFISPNTGAGLTLALLNIIVNDMDHNDKGDKAEDTETNPDNEE